MVKKPRLEAGRPGVLKRYAMRPLLARRRVVVRHAGRDLHAIVAAS